MNHAKLREGQCVRRVDSYICPCLGRKWRQTVSQLNVFPFLKWGILRAGQIHISALTLVRNKCIEIGTMNPGELRAGQCVHWVDSYIYPYPGWVQRQIVSRLNMFIFLRRGISRAEHIHISVPILVRNECIEIGIINLAELRSGKYIHRVDSYICRCPGWNGVPKIGRLRRMGLAMYALIIDEKTNTWNH